MSRIPALVAAVCVAAVLAAQASAESLRSATYRTDPCLARIVDYEGSGWNPTVANRSSGAYGLPQSLPGSKMATAGADWRWNARTQLRWMRSYTRARYGGSCAALSFWLSHRWY